MSKSLSFYGVKAADCQNLDVQITGSSVIFQRHALEQRNHPEGISGLHQEAAAGTAEGQGAGEPSEEARARQPTSDVEDTGKDFEEEGVK